jgi:carboxymethylenebutenolidase
VLAVDLYEGKIGKTAQEASTLMANVDKGRCTAIVAGAVADLKKGDLGLKFARIGTVGYCFGGGWSHETAIQGGKNVQACVMYYGMPDVAPTALAKLKAPVLMIHATQDQWINQKVVDGFQEAMDKAGKSLRVLHYDAAHAFANPSNPKYDKPAADAAYAEVLAFYKKNLG